jgi:hypothetical protein
MVPEAPGTTSKSARSRTGLDMGDKYGDRCVLSIVLENQMLKLKYGTQEVRKNSNVRNSVFLIHTHL